MWGSRVLMILVVAGIVVPIAAIALVGNPGGSSGYRIIAGFLVGFTALGTLPAGADGLLRWILTFAIGWFASFLTLALGAMLLAGRQD